MRSERLRTADLFGLPFTAGPLDLVLGHLVRCLHAGIPQLVFTANTDHVVRLRRRPELARVYQRANLVVADGMPVVWGSRLVGAPLPERVTGVDLMDGLCRALADQGGSVYLLGGTRQVVAQAARAMVERYPGIVLAGAHHGYFGPDEEATVVARIERGGGDVLFVGMGSPRQEEWAAAHAGRLSTRIVVCVGGSLEVLAGMRSRAPRWMQRAGLEWAHRLLQEPGRLWRRYLIHDPGFLSVLLDEWRVRRRWGRQRSPRR